jgi:hypothetical protein
MKPFQMSIASILGFTAVCAVGIAVARDFWQLPLPRIAPEFWEGVLATLSAQALLYAAVQARSRRGKRRAFWRGLLAFGGGYLALCFYPWHNPWEQWAYMSSGSGMLPFSYEGTPLELPTSRLLDILWRQYQSAPGKQGSLFSNYGPFVRMGHLLFGCVFGVIGGLMVSMAGACVGGWTSTRRDAPGGVFEEPSVEEAPPPPEAADGSAS